MKRMLCLWLTLLLLTTNAMADKEVYHQPKDGQLTWAQAVKAAVTFIAQMREIDAALYTEYAGACNTFGPGSQWDADTDDDCWAVSITMPDETQPVRWMLVIVHGTTGEIVHWQMDDRTQGITYLNRLPDESQISYNEMCDTFFDLAACGKHIAEEDLRQFGYIEGSFHEQDGRVYWYAHLFWPEVRDWTDVYEMVMDADNGEIVNSEWMAR